MDKPCKNNFLPMISYYWQVSILLSIEESFYHRNTIQLIVRQVCKEKIALT